VRVREREKERGQLTLLVTEKKWKR